MNKETLLNNVKSWISLDDKIKSLGKELKEARLEKKQITDLLLDTMKDNEIDCFDCNNGQIMYTRNNVKKPVNKKYLNDVLEKYFEGQNHEEATKLCNYILENRDIQVHENIKLKKKKI